MRCRVFQFSRFDSWHLFLVLGCSLLFVGCQQTQNRTPWQAAPTVAPPAQVKIPDISNVTGGLAGAVTDPFARSSGFMRDMMDRQAEQSRLSELQRRELARLTDLYRNQNQKLVGIDREKVRDDRLELARKLQDQTVQLRKKEDELKRLEALRRRALEMDSDNKDLHKQLAQSQQQVRLYEDQLKVMKQQLDETGNRLADSIRVQQQADQEVAALQANLQRQVSLQKRSGATITANSSAQPIREAVQIAGLVSRQDGDVLRIEMPSDQLFLPGTAAINPQAAQLIAQVATAIGQKYPRQKIGIEAHTDNSRLQGTKWRSSHQLSAAQAMAVFEQLAATQRFNPQQMFVLGHGPNYPVAQNNTAAAQQRNRRVEVVIYPETVN